MSMVYLNALKKNKKLQNLEECLSKKKKYYNRYELKFPQKFMTKWVYHSLHNIMRTYRHVNCYAAGVRKYGGSSLANTDVLINNLCNLFRHPLYQCTVNNCQLSWKCINNLHVSKGAYLCTLLHTFLQWLSQKCQTISGKLVHSCSMEYV